MAKNESKRDTIKDLGSVGLSRTARQPRNIALGRRSRLALLVLIFLLANVLSGFAGGWLATRNSSEDLTGQLGSQKKIVTNESKLISQIAKAVGPSVVSVNVDIDTNDPAASFFGLPSSQQAAGTGIIVSSSGYVVTNRHVVPSGTTKVSVTLSDGTELKDVEVIGRTNASDTLDIAFLKIHDAKGHKLKAATIGDSASTQVGDDVVAIGNALGEFQNSVTSGIISGYGRSVVASSGSGNEAESLVDLIQTDAAINEGNSGGPLVNLNGQVIGINTAIAGNAQNIGFAIPINDVQGLIKQVLKSGKFARPYLGVHYIQLTPEVAKELKLETTKGAYITPSEDQFNSSVIPGSAADKAGLHEKDIIVSVNGKKIDQTHSLPGLLGAYQPGDKVKLTVLRGTETLHLTATLGTQPTAQ
jgi:serine protease Do